MPRSRQAGGRAAITSVATALLLIATAGCSSIAQDDPVASVPAASDAPSFSGPFAAEYTQAWGESESEFVRQTIADEKITESEWSEVESRMASCFADAGATFEGHTPQGGYSAQKNSLSSKRMNQVMTSCEISSGEHLIGFLWFSAQKNPENIPPEIIISECMIRTGVVASDYTPEDFLRDNATMEFPYLDPDTGPQGFLACNEDPTLESAE